MVDYIKKETNLVDCLTNLEEEINAMLARKLSGEKKLLDDINKLITKKEAIFNTLNQSKYSAQLFEPGPKGKQQPRLEEYDKSVNLKKASINEQISSQDPSKKTLTSLQKDLNKLIQEQDAKKAKKKENKKTTRDGQRLAAERKATAAAAATTIERMFRGHNARMELKVASVTDEIQGMIDKIPNQTDQDKAHFTQLIKSFKENLKNVLPQLKEPFDTLLDNTNQQEIFNDASVLQNPTVDINNFILSLKKLTDAMETKLKSLGAHTLDDITKKIKDNPNSNFFQNLSEKLFSNRTQRPSSNSPNSYNQENLPITKLGELAELTPKYINFETATPIDDNDTKILYEAMINAITAAEQNTGYGTTANDRDEKIQILKKIAENFLNASDKESRSSNLEYFILTADTHRSHRTSTQPSFFSKFRGDTKTISTFKKNVGVEIDNIKDPLLTRMLKEKLELSQKGPSLSI